MEEGNRTKLSSRQRSRFFAWWYFSIGLGFLLLALNRWLIGARGWLVWLRLVIAGGFAMLGYIELRSRR